MKLIMYARRSGPLLNILLLLETTMTNYNAQWLSRAELEELPFAHLGENVQIDRSVSMVGVENLRFGDNVRIDAGTIIVASGTVWIGSHVHVSAFCYLAGRGGIRLEDFSNLSTYVSIHSVSDDPSGASLTNPTIPDTYKTLQEAEVVVGRHALVLAKATLLPGTRLGEGAVVGAHSLARGEVPAWMICAGTPARPVKERKRDALALEKEFLQKELR